MCRDGSTRLGEVEVREDVVGDDGRERRVTGVEWMRSEC